MGAKMIDEKIDFTEDEVYALFAAYYSACFVVGELLKLDEVPRITPDEEYESKLMNMQSKLSKLSSKFDGHSKNNA